ncbi:MAG: 2-hydroxyacyl-CoA dehydratase [Planctomycetes bacterium]|nr:2-hydroxyacyl-CoA dehydratase [Planctomycetota bacterium]
MSEILEGAGRDLQKKLLTDWYADLEKGEGPVAYLLIGGNPIEVLHAAGFRTVFPEVNALQCGVRKVAGDLILKAEEQGYPADACGYVKNDLGLTASGGAGPFGQMPRPDLLVCTYAGCGTTLKWFETLARHFNAPLVVVDVPALREGTPDPHAVRYVAGQFEELTQTCAKITGRTFQHDRLAENLDRSRQAENLWVSILESCRQTPSPFDAFFEAVFFMAPIYVLRGSAACVDYYRTALDEIRRRAEARTGPVPRERHRIVIDGPPPWPHFRAFWEMFKRWDACCVSSTYSRVGGAWDDGVRHDPARPFESMAEYALRCYTNLTLRRRRDLLQREIERHRADALVMHAVRSCRPFSVGQPDTREFFSREKGIPTLYLESDLADPRYFSETEMRNRIDAFFETLEHRSAAAKG